MLKRSAAFFACLLAATLTSTVSDAAAKDEAITISTIAQPSEDAGIDKAALRTAMEDAIKLIDPKLVQRPVTIALSVIATSNDPSATCSISIAVADRKKGHILGSATGQAQAAPNAHGDQRANVARIALANAVNRVPDVVTASK